MIRPTHHQSAILRGNPKAQSGPPCDEKACVDGFQKSTSEAGELTPALRFAPASGLQSLRVDSNCSKGARAGSDRLCLRVGRGPDLSLTGTPV